MILKHFRRIGPGTWCRCISLSAESRRCVLYRLAGGALWQGDEQHCDLSRIAYYIAFPLISSRPSCSSPTWVA